MTSSAVAYIGAFIAADSGGLSTFDTGPKYLEMDVCFVFVDNGCCMTRGFFGVDVANGEGKLGDTARDIDIMKYDGGNGGNRTITTLTIQLKLTDMYVGSLLRLDFHDRCVSLPFMSSVYITVNTFLVVLTNIFLLS